MHQAALFGGTFNPVHFGHLRVAEEMREGFGLDKIYFIPAANPPHKTSQGLAPAADRYEMLRCATEKNPGFAVSDIELRRRGRSYTIDTVEQISASLPPGSRCLLAMGFDAFAEIETWKSYRQIFDRIEVIVLSRPDGVGMEDWPGALGSVISAKVSNRYRYDPKKGRFVHPEKRAVYPFGVTGLEISATRIRSLVAEGASIRYLVPETVEAYIYKKGLYV